MHVVKIAFYCFKINSFCNANNFIYHHDALCSLQENCGLQNMK